MCACFREGLYGKSCTGSRSELKCPGFGPGRNADRLHTGKRWKILRKYEEAKRPEEGLLSRRIFTWTAGPEDAGRPVRDIILYKWKLAAHDVARAKYETDHGITVNGEAVYVDRRLSEGDTLRLVLTDHAPEKIVPTDDKIEIVYEDEDLICLNKPAGVVVHPSHGHFADSLANRLAFYFQQKNEPHEIRTVGRLDKDTSGLICFAKSRSAVARLTDQAEKGIRRKIYYALCEGVFDTQEGVIEVPIEREFAGMQKRIVREGGDYALTFYTVLRQYGGYALVKAEIRTGRTHQIRVHMDYIGHPLLGDPLYGSGIIPQPVRGDSDAVLCRAALHAGEIMFQQPFSGQEIHLRAALPDDMRAFLDGTEAELFYGTGRADNISVNGELRTLPVSGKVLDF